MKRGGGSHQPHRQARPPYPGRTAATVARGSQKRTPNPAAPIGGMMPLDRTHVTQASRVMLPTYPLFFTGFGVALLLTPDRVMQATPSFATASQIMPLPTWGLIILGAAAFQVAALASRRRSMYLATLGVALVCMVIWVGVFAYAAAQGGAPWTAPMWPAFIATACYATMRSLESREV